MAWFKNKETELVWEVVGEDNIKRCENDDNYEAVAYPNKKTRPSKKSDAE